MANTPKPDDTGGMSLATTPLTELQAQAMLYTQQIALNYLQLGRVLTEAKAQVKYGEWLGWLNQYAPVGERSAQRLMALWQRFGGSDLYAGLDKSKLEALLALPEGTEADFAAEHDLKGASVRDVQQLVKAKSGSTEQMAQGLPRPDQTGADAAQVNKAAEKLGHAIAADFERESRRATEAGTAQAMEQTAAEITDTANAAGVSADELTEVARVKAEQIIADAEQAAKDRQKQLDEEVARRAAELAKQQAA